jgi:hypothetical protein
MKCGRQDDDRMLEMEATMRHLFRCVMALMVLFVSPALAQTTDESAISKLLHTTFDRPEAPLTIAPVVVSGNHAIAGWIQGDMGGRALLRRKGQSWELILRAGDGIKSQDALSRAFLATRRYVFVVFSRFEGMLMMDGSGNHPPIDHAKPPRPSFPRAPAFDAELFCA